MIKFLNASNDEPLKRFREEYDKAYNRKQDLIEAISIASYSTDNNYVDSRFVNLKIVDDNKFIFFSNYNSPKSHQFASHNQIAANIYWHKTNTQIRLKAFIKRSSNIYNKKYFNSRSEEKNALAISSNQSNIIESYSQVVQNYESVKNKKNLKECPNYWGGFEFIPFEIEFWKGNKHRLNKRDLYTMNNHEWIHNILEP